MYDCKGKGFVPTAGFCDCKVVCFLDFRIAEPIERHVDMPPDSSVGCPTAIPSPRARRACAGGVLSVVVVIGCRCIAGLELPATALELVVLVVRREVCCKGHRSDRAELEN
jgi:hypothetical protein